MKKYLVLIVFCFSICSFAQIITIPDANFKAKLIQLGVDTNTDGEIQANEAQVVTSLNLSNSNISDLTGIEFFVNLVQLFVQNNSLVTLNTSGLDNLTTLNIQPNPQLLSLNVANCSSLTGVYFSNGILSSLNVSGCTSLTVINVDNNNLTSLDASGLIDLVGISCASNEITSLNVTNCISLSSIDCGTNQLTELSANFLPLLSTLDAPNNIITSLNLSSLPSLQTLDIRQSPIASIDVSNLPNLSVLRFGNINVPIEFLNIKNGRSTSLFFTNPSIPINYLCADEIEINTLSTFSNISIVNSYCSFTPGGNYNTITGSILFDSDNNGCDANDVSYPNIRIDINNGTNQGATFTNSEGNYNFYVNLGNFTVTPNIENPTWFTFSPATATIPFSNNNNNVAVQNFCLSANGNHPDVEIVIAPIFPARPGFTATYQVLIKNKGNFMLSGQFMLNYNDELLDFLDSGIFPNEIISGTLMWNFTDLMPFETRQTNVSFMVNSPTDAPPVNIGDELVFQAAVTPIQGDENPQDNVFDFNQIVVGSYDPNDITCLEGDVVPASEIGEYLHYVINFENTGNSEAENIVVRTNIDATKFDVNSLQMLHTSHNAYIRQNANVVEFIFQNIALESGGHGNVLLKIKTKDNLQNGATVGKQANIYFDYNAPIETNLANTTFQTLSSGDFEIDHSISVHPNPTTSKINVICNSTIKSIQLYDIQGRLLQTQIVNETTASIDISNQSNGIYFAKITSEAGVKVEKIIKE